MRMTENPEIGVFVHIPNPAGFFVQPDRGGGAVVSVPVSHARIHVFSDTLGWSYQGDIYPVWSVSASSRDVL